MSESQFNTNFKNMLRYIGKAACEDPSCPMTTMILSQLIDWLFNDEKRASTLILKFRDNIENIDKKYKNGMGESCLNPVSKSYKDALSRKDRSLFKHIDLFPGHTMKQYNDQITWFSNFLVSGMKDKYMEFVWKYLYAMDKIIASK